MIKKISKILIDKKNLFTKIVIILIFLLGLMVRLYYFSYTDILERSYDAGGHMDYINLLSRGVMPEQDQCWQCYHPPLYYLCGACIVKSCHFLGLSDNFANSSLQLFSLFLFSIFLIIAFFILSKFLNRDKRLLILAWVLLVFWPSGIIHSVRIGNDVLMYLFSILSLWFLLLWNEKNKTGYLMASLLFALLSIYTKSNGLVIFFVILFVVPFKWFIKRDESFFSFLKKKVLLLVASVFIAMIPLLINLINFTGWDNKNSSWIVSNSHKLPGQLIVNNKIENFLSFSTSAFIETPFIDPWNDFGGRQFYLVTILKNSLWGEFRNKKDDLTVIIVASIINAILFLMTILVLVGSLFLKDYFWRKNFILVFYGLALVVSSVFMRLIAPFSCSNDFRYIFPILIPAIFILVSILKEFKKRKLHFFFWVSYLILAFFSILSFIFFVTGFGNLISV